MRPVADADRIRRFMHALGAETDAEARVYELASPMDFIPVIGRGHAQDVEDIQSMVRTGLVESDRALAYYQAVEPDLYRYPAIHPPTLRRAVEEFFGSRRTG